MSEENTHLLDDFNKQSYDEWVNIAEKSLKGKKISKLTKTNYDGIEIKPIYNPDDLGQLSEQLANIPGEYPYINGTSSLPEHHKPAVCGIISAFRPKEFNEQLLHLLNAGQNAIHIKLVSPDDDLSQYTHGVVITSLSDFEIIFTNIDISQYPLFIEFDYYTNYAFDLFEKYLNSLDLDADELNINICFDPIANLLNLGYSQYGLFDFLGCINCTTENEKHINTKLININGTIYKNKGCGTVQEIAFALAEALEYIYKLLDFDYPIDEVATKIHFTISIGSDFFSEIAKIRAMRAFWAFIIKELGGNDESQKLTVHLVSDLTNKSPLDKETNILRETVETAAATIAGADTLLLYPYTFPFEQTNELSQRGAKNIQLILQHETDLNSTLSPAAGSWYIESLTNEMLNKIKELLNDIDKQGGLLAALKQGYIQEQIKETASKKLNDILSGKSSFIGVNKYPNPKDNIDSIYNLPVQTELQDYLDKLDCDIPAPFLENEPLQIEALDDFRPADIFYNLRRRSMEYEKSSGRKPLVFIAAIGSIKEHKARVDFTRDFLATGGFHIQYNEKGYSDTDDALTDWEKSEANIFVVCSTDAHYIKNVPELCKKFKKSKPESKGVMAGFPKEKIEEYRQAGIDYFIHFKSNIVVIINELYNNIK